MNSIYSGQRIKLQDSSLKMILQDTSALTGFMWLSKLLSWISCASPSSPVFLLFTPSQVSVPYLFCVCLFGRDAPSSSFHSQSTHLKHIHSSKSCSSYKPRLYAPAFARLLRSPRWYLCYSQVYYSRDSISVVFV